MSQLSILHCNDAYRVTPQKLSSHGDTIDVAQFGALLDDIRRNWRIRSDGAKDGLSFFSGDLFSPSQESTVTRGSHLVPVMNELAPDVALTGNHDFDFGYPHLTELVADTKFPWVLSNVVDENTNNVPEHLHLFQVLERSGIKVGIIGLVEPDWISTVSAWPANFKHKDMAKTGIELSKKLREEHHCDLIIALTHSRLPNDIKLAKELLALSPSAQEGRPIAGEHGVDILLGGHDHSYFVSKGVTTWDGYDASKPCLGSEGDDGDILVVKSGTDFRELSELALELENTPPGSVRKKVIKAIHGKRRVVQPGMPSSKNLQEILHNVLSSVSESLSAPVCISQVELDLRSCSLRTNETAAGNWFADVLRHAYDDVLYTKSGSGADGVITNSGTLRGDSQYPAGDITMGNILGILPFDDPVVVIELDGESLWDAIESALSRYPAQEGRFPVISGFRVSWDSRRPPGQRVLGIWLLQDAPKTSSKNLGTNSGTGEAHVLVDGEAIKREKDGRKYKIVTREYIAAGHDGYTAFSGHEYLIDDEHGQRLSSLVRKYLLGAQYVNKMIRIREEQDPNHLHPETADVIQREIEHRERHTQTHHFLPKFAQSWENAVMSVLHRLRPRAHYQDHFNITAREHMTSVDCYDGKKIRQGLGEDSKNDNEKLSREDLLVIHPVVDGRLKDEAKNQLNPYYGMGAVCRCIRSVFRKN